MPFKKILLVILYVICYIFLYFRREKHLRPALSAKHLGTLPTTGYTPPVWSPATCIHPSVMPTEPHPHPPIPEGVEGIEPSQRRTTHPLCWG